MLFALAHKWWMLLLNGICAIIFGIMAFAWPGMTLLTLVAIFGVFCLADGVTAIGSSFSAHHTTGKPWGHMLLIGLLSIAAGITAFLWPGITVVTLLLVIAFWAIIRGIFEIIVALKLRKLIENEWLLILAGIVSILFGVMLITRPGVGALAMMWLIGAFAVFHGFLLVALSFRLRAVKQLSALSGSLPRLPT